jgi:hypothetical protein
LLVARSEGKLKDIANRLTEQYKINALYLSIDLSNANAPQEVFNWVKSQGLEITILINNAGYGIWGGIENTPLTDLQNMMQLNMTSLASLCHVFIPQLKKQFKSYILNVASTASYQAVPYLATYAASKSFVVLFSRGLRWELKKTSISVTCLSPGATSTGFVDRAGMDSSLKEKAEKLSMTPKLVAKIGIDAMFAGKAEVIPGFVNWVSAKFTSFLPKSLIERIALSLYKKTSLP